MFLSQGQTVQEVMRQLATAEQTHHCWQGRQVERNVGHVMSPDYCTGWLSARVLMRRTVLGAAQSLEDIYGRSRGGESGAEYLAAKGFLPNAAPNLDGYAKIYPVASFRCQPGRSTINKVLHGEVAQGL